ncbi:hypothetical protein Tco_1167959, partial [Tanacetum coccineum]
WHEQRWPDPGAAARPMSSGLSQEGWWLADGDDDNEEDEWFGDVVWFGKLWSLMYLRTEASEKSPLPVNNHLHLSCI